MSVPLACRQLLARPGRALAGVAGIAVALLLVLALKAILAGAEERLTAYIERSGADVIVAQQGVDTMHMSESALPEEAVAAIGSLPGVEEARPILYVATMFEKGGAQGIAYLIGDDSGGAPIPVVAGSRPRSGEVLLDRGLSRKLGVRTGSTVQALGRAFRVSGEVEGLASITNSVVFMPRRELARLLGSEASSSASPSRASSPTARRSPSSGTTPFCARSACGGAVPSASPSRRSPRPWQPDSSSRSGSSGSSASSCPG